MDARAGKRLYNNDLDSKVKMLLANKTAMTP